jgi:hypothetical protein
MGIQGHCSPCNRAVRALPNSAAKMLNEIYRQTGFVGTLLLGGDDPENPGEPFIIKSVGFLNVVERSAHHNVQGQYRDEPGEANVPPGSYGL